MTSGHRSCNIINRKLLETISQMSQNCESKYSEARFLSALFFQLARSGPVPRKTVRVHLRSWSRSYSTCSRHSRSGGRVGPTTPRRRNSLFGAPRSPADAPSGGTVSPAASEKSATSTWLGYGVRLRDRIRDRVRDRVRVRPPRRRARPVPSREARDPCRPSVACLQ